MCREYRQAKHPNEQIKIIADLTCKTREEIEEILVRNGQMKPKKETWQTSSSRYGVTWTEEMDRMLLLLIERGFTRKKIAEFMAFTKPRVENRIQKLKKEGRKHVPGLQIFRHCVCRNELRDGLLQENHAESERGRRESQGMF